MSVCAVKLERSGVSRLQDRDSEIVLHEGVVPFHKDPKIGMMQFQL